jgi:hypothetical protein
LIIHLIIQTILARSTAYLAVIGLLVLVALGLWWRRSSLNVNCAEEHQRLPPLAVSRSDWGHTGATAGFRPVADGLDDVVAVWIENEGAVVLRVVLGAQAGWAVVAASGGQPGSMERLHGGLIGAVALQQQLVAKRTQRLLVERLALFQIASCFDRGRR